MAHPELGKDVLLRFAEAVKAIAVIEQQPKLEGRFMTMILMPNNNK
jgi:translation initiation factor IF-3